MTQVKELDLRPTFIISGRIPFDDEDSTYEFRAKDEAEAMELFKTQIYEDSGRTDQKEVEKEHGSEVYFNGTTVHYADALLEVLKFYHGHYSKLHDGLSDMVEEGRLSEAEIPDDYQWLVEQLADGRPEDAVTKLFKAMKES